MHLGDCHWQQNWYHAHRRKLGKAYYKRRASAVPCRHFTGTTLARHWHVSQVRRRASTVPGKNESNLFSVQLSFTKFEREQNGAIQLPTCSLSAALYKS